jgi:hypothetical protein
VSHDTFSKALEEMSKDRDEISRLADEYGKSLTVLRCRAATVPAVRTPEWAMDEATPAKLVPFLSVGAWSTTTNAARLSLLLPADGRRFTELEMKCQTLAQLNEAPVGSIWTYRGVISEVDLLHAIFGVVTSDDLTRYFSMARLVLGEDDPPRF